MYCNDQNPDFFFFNFSCEISDVRKTSNKPGMNRATHLNSTVWKEAVFFRNMHTPSEQRASMSYPV